MILYCIDKVGLFSVFKNKFNQPYPTICNIVTNIESSFNIMISVLERFTWTYYNLLKAPCVTRKMGQTFYLSLLCGSQPSMFRLRGFSIMWFRLVTMLQCYTNNLTERISVQIGEYIGGGGGGLVWWGWQSDWSWREGWRVTEGGSGGMISRLYWLPY